MADIHNDYAGAHITFEAGSTQNGDVNITGSTFHQHPTPAAQEAPAGGETKSAQLTNRQAIVLAAALLDLTLDAEFTNQSALARLLAALTGRSEESLRKTISTMANHGYDTQGARQDMRVVATLLQDLQPDMAERLRNDAREE